jgi:hypothetical protein
MKKTRVYAIEECDNVHEISNDDFMHKAEEQGYAWSLLSFQNLINGEGSNNISLEEFKTLYYKFIDIEI